MEDRNTLQSVCERLPQCATDYILACLLHEAEALALTNLTELGIDKEEAEEFVRIVKAHQQQDQNQVLWVKEALGYNDEQMIDLARTIFRTYEQKP